MSSDQSEGGTGSQLTNQTVVGQARALVSCVPSPYDRDVLGFQVEWLSVTQWLVSATPSG